MRFYKAFTITGIIALIWVIAGFFPLANQAGGFDPFNTIIFSIILASVVTFTVLSFVLREPKPDQTALPARLTRFEHWFESLDDDQLNVLRHRLTDDYDEDYSSVGSLMNERKAKRS